MLTRRSALRGLIGLGAGAFAGSSSTVASSPSESGLPPGIRCVLGEGDESNGFDMHPLDDDGEVLGDDARRLMRGMSPGGWRFRDNGDGRFELGVIVYAMLPATIDRLTPANDAAIAEYLNHPRFQFTEPCPSGVESGSPTS